MKNILKNFYRKYNKNFQQEYLFKKELSYFSGCSNILDLGCGEGTFISFSPKRITGIDSNKKSILICNKNKLQAVVGSVTKLPFKSNSFDGVHCSHLIEHLTPFDAHKMLAETTRVLKKGGMFVLSTPILWEGFYDDFTHVKPYNKESVLRYLVYEGQEKTLGGIGKFKEIDFYWRYRLIILPTKIGKLISGVAYRYGFHSLTRDAYTLVFKKL